MEKKLTKLQRYTAYCIMQEEMENSFIDIFYSPCSLIHHLFGLEVYPMWKLFPELAKLWHPNIGRRELLTKCIIETSPK